jgi:hypothetical protein
MSVGLPEPLATPWLVAEPVHEGGGTRTNVR